MVPLLLSDNHNRGVFCQVAFPHISESTKRATFRITPIDSSQKVAYSKVSSVFSWDAAFLCYCQKCDCFAYIWRPQNTPPPCCARHCVKPLGLGRCRMAWKVSGHDSICRRRNHPPIYYGPVALSDNHNLGVFCQVAFPHISECTKRATFRITANDSPQKVAFSKVSSIFS